MCPNTDMTTIKGTQREKKGNPAASSATAVWSPNAIGIRSARGLVDRSGPPRFWNDYRVESSTSRFLSGNPAFLSFKPNPAAPTIERIPRSRLVFDEILTDLTTFIELHSGSSHHPRPASNWLVSLYLIDFMKDSTMVVLHSERFFSRK